MHYDRRERSGHELRRMKLTYSLCNSLACSLHQCTCRGFAVNDMLREGDATGQGCFQPRGTSSTVTTIFTCIIQVIFMHLPPTRTLTIHLTSQLYSPQVVSRQLDGQKGAGRQTRQGLNPDPGHVCSLTESNFHSAAGLLTLIQRHVEPSPDCCVVQLLTVSGQSASRAVEVAAIGRPK